MSEFTYPNARPHASRVSVANGASVATFTNANVSGFDWEGAQLWIFPGAAAPYCAGIVAAGEQEGVYPPTEVPLISPWRGSTITDAEFFLIGGPAFADAARSAALNMRFRNQTQQNMGLVGDLADVTDFAQVLNNTILWDGAKSVLYRWRNGALEVLNLARLGTPFGRWDGSASKFALAASGNVAVNFSNGPHFSCTHTGNFTVQLPTNVIIGSTYYVTFIASGGGHAAAFAAGHSGVSASVINTANGAKTRLKFVVNAQTGGTATSVTVYEVPYVVNDIVEDGGYLFISNTDNNVDYPKFSGGNPISDESWTWVPSLKGDPGSAAVTGTSSSSVAIGTGAKTFVINETDPVRGWAVGAQLRIASAAMPAARYMAGIVTSFDGVNLVVEVSVTAGSGTYTDWTISLDGLRGLPGADAGHVYLWNTSVVDGNPGNATARANNLNLSLATQIYINDTSVGGANLEAFWNSLANSTNTDKGTLQLTRLADKSTATFTVTGVTDASGYTKISVSGHSGATAFADGVQMSLQFSRTGNKGADGLGTGDVSAAANFGADNRLIRSDGNLKVVQASQVIVDDNGGIVLPSTTNAFVRSSRFRMLDTAFDHEAVLYCGIDLPETRFLLIHLGQTSQILTINANTTLAGPASTTVAGPIEIATAAEFRAKTDTTRCLGVAETWNAAAEVGLAYAATVLVDLALGMNFLLNLTDNATLGNPSNAKPGTSGVIRIVQSGGGNRTLSYGANWYFGPDGAPVLSIGANQEDLLFYYVIGTNHIFGTLFKRWLG